jgi:hypothetical protein
MRRRARLKPQSPQLARQTGLGVILRALRVSVVSMCAKRTQFGGVKCAKRTQSCETKPICPGRPGVGAGGRDRDGSPGSNCTKRSQFARRRGAIVRNKPNSAANRAKRTQFDHLPRRGRRDRSCETKPIGPRKMSGEDAQPTKSRGAIVRNEPNSRRGRVDGASGTRGSCAKQTQFRRADRPGPGGNGAKRTQFGEEVSSLKFQVLSRRS